MAFDTKYRPTHYSDVLGQEAHAHVLKEFVRRDKGFHQSYLFAGQHGSGKTTMGRILARALLCSNPTDGEPCDECMSCKDILEKGSSECFTEFDAATKSGKDHILKVVEDLEYSTFAGKQRVYLFDESHRLSKQAVDALLKPLEDEQTGSENKRLVCIFCTTEPEKMVDTVWSRCAPQFSIKVVKPEVIAERLAWICKQEEIEFEEDGLIAIAAISESHIRDALKKMESIALLGPVSMESVRKVLQLDANESLARILAFLGSDLASAMVEADQLVLVVAPTTCYERLAKTAMLAFKVSIGAAKPPPYWKKGLIEQLGELHGPYLIAFAQCFSSRPGRPSSSMLSLDLARLHQIRAGLAPSPTPIAPPPAKPATSQPAAGEVPSTGTSTAPEGTSDAAAGNVAPVAQVGPPVVLANQAMTYETPTGRHIDQRGVKKKRDAVARNRNTPTGDPPLGPDEFASALGRRIRELKADGNRRGPAGRDQLGGAGAHSTG
jgi:DNA polymerase III subunit gamma/tau